MRGFTLRAKGVAPTTGLNSLEFIVQDGVNRGGGMAIGPVPEPNRWYHVVGTYDGKAVRLFLNGDLVRERAWSGSILVDNRQPILVGRGENLGRFDGLIDEVAIYDRALSPEEIQDNFDAGSGVTGTTG